MPIRLFCLWLAERLVKLAFWASPVSHVGITMHEDGHLTTTLLPDFGLEDYRRAVATRRHRPTPRPRGKRMPPPEAELTKEKPPRRPNDVEASTSTLSN